MVASLLFRICVLVALTANSTSAWMPSTFIRSQKSRPTALCMTEPRTKTPVHSNLQHAQSFEPLDLSPSEGVNHLQQDAPASKLALATSLGIFAMAVAPHSALAAVAGAPNSLGSAFAAYGHFVGILISLGAVTTERFTIKPFGAMTPEEEERLVIADIVYGLAGLILVVTGYLRATQYEKGWDFYAHEPLFWLKMVFVAVWGASSFFNTTKIIQRSISQRETGQWEPMSEQLAARMIQICNAELVALLVVPLTATTMARGVFYNNDFPWPLGAIATFLTLGGLGYKYIKEALEFPSGPGGGFGGGYMGQNQNQNQQSPFMNQNNQNSPNPW